MTGNSFVSDSTSADYRGSVWLTTEARKRKGNKQQLWGLLVLNQKNTFIYLHLGTETNNYNRIGKNDWWLHNNKESAIESQINTGKFLTLWHFVAQLALVFRFVALSSTGKYLFVMNSLTLCQHFFLYLHTIIKNKFLFNYSFQNLCGYWYAISISDYSLPIISYSTCVAEQMLCLLCNYRCAMNKHDCGGAGSGKWGS